MLSRRIDQLASKYLLLCAARGVTYRTVNGILAVSMSSITSGRAKLDHVPHFGDPTCERNRCFAPRPASVLHRIGAAGRDLRW